MDLMSTKINQRRFKMSNKTKFCWALMILIVVLYPFSIWAAGEKEEAIEEEKPLEKVVVFVRTGAEADANWAVSKAYSEKTGNPVEIMEAGRRGFYATVHTQLIGGTTEFDLAQANNVDVAALADAGAIAPIEPYIYDSKLTDLKEYDLDDFPFVYSYNGKIYTIPFDVSTHFLYYRTDLIPEPPETWDEYIEVARKWTKSLNPNSPTLFGASLTALAGSEQPKVFYSIMWSKGGWILDKDFNIGVDSQGAIEAAEFYTKLRDEKLWPPDTFSWGFSNVLDALKTGVVAMAGPYWNAAYPMIKSSDSPFKDKIAITLVPGDKQPDGTINRTPFQQGKVLLLNANSQHKEAAWKYLQFLTSKEGMRIMAEAGGTPSRISVLSDPTMEPEEYYDMMVASLKIARGDPGPPYYPEQHEAMNQALSAIVTGTGEPKASLEQVGRTLRKLVDEWYK
jgi:multiple sugar transport system substrate-binding protein